ncbi:MAG: hypothetical protein R3B51_08675 [Thermodesulfobacteriota bacterium]
MPKGVEHAAERADDVYEDADHVGRERGFDEEPARGEGYLAVDGPRKPTRRRFADVAEDEVLGLFGGVLIGGEPSPVAVVELPELDLFAADVLFNEGA